MPTDVLLQYGTPIVFADATDFSSPTHGFTRTHQIDLTSLANNANRQSDKADLDTGGTTDRVPLYFIVRVGIEFASAPTAGNTIEFWWSASSSATAGTGNDGGASGSDGAYKASEEDEWERQLILLGTLKATNDGAGTVQIQTIGRFTPPTQWGQVIVGNESGQALDSDAIQMFIALIPVFDEAQT